MGTGKLRVEFHCHTIYSKDSLSDPAALVETARKKGVDRLVVTDHNSIQGALLAKAIDPERIIVGEEIMTLSGELLAAFVLEEIPAGLEPKETIALLRQQGAFISVSHPFDKMRSGHWEEQDLLEIIPLVDAIEVFNARCIDGKYNDQAQLFAGSHNLAGTVGSDAHALFELGRATFVVPEFSTADELRQNIRAAEYQLRKSSAWVHFYSRYASWRKDISPRKNPEKSV